MKQLARKLTEKELEERLRKHLDTRKSTLWGMWDLSQESSKDSAVEWIVKLCSDLEIIKKS
jgi:hypothetical protein